jgi:hypothetical protein
VLDGDLGEGGALEIVSEMNTGGVVFGDGIESDRLRFEWGMRVKVEIAATRLELVTPRARVTRTSGRAQRRRPRGAR